MPTLIAEDVLLLVLDRSGAFTPSSEKRKPALAGAVLAELALVGAVEIETEGGLWKRTAVVVANRAAVSDPLLLGALDVIAEKKRSPKDVVNRLGRRLPEQLSSRLADRGILRRDESRILGVFPRTRWPAADSGPGDALRADVRRVLLEGGQPDARIATLIAVLAAADILHKVLGLGSRSKRELKQRAEEIAAGGWATEAVRKAIEAAQAAVMAGITAATAASVVGGS